MNSVIKDPLMIVWVILVMSTGLSWWLGFGDSHYIWLSILIVALIKVRLIMWYFMEVRHSPAWLKRTCDGWLLFVFAMVASIKVFS